MNGLAQSNDITFHHVGVASQNYSQDELIFSMLGYKIEGASFEDPIQGIRGQFLAGNGPRIELITPMLTSESAIMKGVFEKGVKLYHLAFETTNLHTAIDEIRRQGGKLVVEPVPAVAFDNREIAFAFLRNLLLVELIAI